jgi:hypothetical protein
MRAAHRFVFAAAIILVVFASAPAAAQGPGRTCDIAGTWYDGFYVGSITPVAAGRYQVSFNYGFNPYPGPTGQWYGFVTPWVGEITKNGDHKFDGYIMSYWTWKDQEAADGAAAFFAAMGYPVNIDAGLPETDVIRFHMELPDCNTLSNVIDAWLVYFPTEANPVATPLLTQPDLDYLGVIGAPVLEETYSRLANACPFCPPPVTHITAAPTSGARPLKRPLK